LGGSTIESVSGSVVQSGTFYVGVQSGNRTDVPLYVTVF
jgi:hypothetical protein